MLQARYFERGVGNLLEDKIDSFLAKSQKNSHSKKEKSGVRSGESFTQLNELKGQIR